MEEEVVSARFTPHSRIGEKTDKNKKEGREEGRKGLVWPLMSRDVAVVDHVVTTLDQGPSERCS